jgi:two-component system response regulator YesN
MIMASNGSIAPHIWSRIRYFSKIHKGICYLEQHLSDHVTLAQVAAAACYEETAFSRSFRDKIGVSFRDFTQALRVVRSIERMRSSDLSLCEIAFSVGFNSLTTFGRAFRKWMGVSPSSYRRSLLARNKIALVTTQLDLDADLQEVIGDPKRA